MAVHSIAVLFGWCEVAVFVDQLEHQFFRTGFQGVDAFAQGK